jgi:RND family efflux transporter MFP subunit
LSHGNRALQGLALSLLAASLCAGCGAEIAVGDGESEGAGARKEQAPLVIAASVELRPMVRYLETTTKIESEREITIHPETGGIVVAVLAEEGDEVEAGDVLVELEHDDEELSKRDAEVALQEAHDQLQQPILDRAEAASFLASAELSFEQAQRDSERDQRLFEDTEVASPVSKQKLEASRLAMARANADREQARIALEKVDLASARAATAVARAEVALSRAEHALAERTVRAPFAGMVAARSVRIGQTVGPADAIFVLTDTEHIRAVFYRAQEELDLFRPGGRSAEGRDGPALTFEATTEALPGARFAGRVQRVSPTIDRESGQFRVTGIFDPPAAGAPVLLPGMLVRLRIATDRHQEALVVPKRAVRREGDLAFVLCITPEDTIRRVLLREGYEDDDLIEILPLEAGSVSADDRVVAVGSRELEDGDAVKVEVTLEPQALLAEDPASPASLDTD